MSSAIYVTLSEGEEVSSADWAGFCTSHAVTWSPKTIGGNVFYAGDVEVTFGTTPPGDTQPPASAAAVTFSTYFLGRAMPEVAALARAFWLRFGGSVEAADELRQAFLAAPDDECEGAP